MLSLISILMRPRRCAEQLKASPRWLIPFIALAFISVLIMIAMHPHLIRMTLAHLPESASESAKAAVRSALEGELAARCAFLPFRLLIGWASFALVLLYSCQAWGRIQPVRFVQIFSLEVHAEGALLLGQAGALLLTLFGRSADAVVVPFGLDAVVPASSDFVMRTLLNAFNPFAAWYVVIIISGVAACCEFRRSKAALVVLSVWGLNVGFSVVGTYILQETFHFRL